MSESDAALWSIAGTVREMSMKVLKQNSPLTDTEFDRLGDFLANCSGCDAMNLEELDGFFAALIAGPETAKRNPAAMIRMRARAAYERRGCLRRHVK